MAARVGRYVDAAGPGAAGEIEILAVGHAKNRHRGESLASVAAGEHDRILAPGELELGVADGNRVAALGEAGNFASAEKTHFVRLEKRNDFPVPERGCDLHYPS